VNYVNAAAIAISIAALSATPALAVPQVVTYAYDAAGRVTTVGYDGAWTIAYTYDANGNITALTSAGVTDVPDRETASGVPRTYELNQNSPNPFTGATAMRYQLPRPGTVRLEGFDVTGRKVRTLVDAVQAAGYYAIAWDGNDDSGNRAPSGIYFWKLAAGETLKTIKVMLIR